MNDKISIIIPIYNTKNYLDRCVKSVISQKYTNLEIILIDDGSEDGSAELCDALENADERILVYHQINQGPSAARNKGLELATGNYIVFVDSDDFIDANMVADLYSELIDNGADMSACSAQLVYPDGTTKEYLKNQRIEMNSTKETLWHCLCDNSLGTVVWAKLYKRELFKNILFPIGKNAEDEYVVWKLVANCNKVIYTGKCQYNLYERNNSLCSSGVATLKMWHLEAWCERENYLRSHNYFQYADITLDCILREVYKNRNNIANEIAKENCKMAMNYYKNHKKHKSIKDYIKSIIINLSLK